MGFGAALNPSYRSRFSSHTKPPRRQEHQVCRAYRHFDIEWMVAALRITETLKRLIALKMGTRAKG